MVSTYIGGVTNVRFGSKVVIRLTVVVGQPALGECGKNFQRMQKILGRGIQL